MYQVKKKLTRNTHQIARKIKGRITSNVGEHPHLSQQEHRLVAGGYTRAGKKKKKKRAGKS